MIIALSGLYGLIMGSFMGAWVWRTHDGISIAKGRSKCANCQKTLAIKDLVPIISWLSLKGKCRYCQDRIPKQDILIEASTAFLFMLSALVLRPVGVLELVGFGLWLLILSVLIALCVYDLRWMVLPDSMMLPGVVLILLYLTQQIVANNFDFSLALNHFGAAALAFLFFYGLYAVSKGTWMGGGDVKLVFVLGLMLGLSKTLLGLSIAFNAGALISLGLIAIKLKKRKDLIPFGPFLIGGAITAFLFGEQLINAYLSLVAPGL